MRSLILILLLSLAAAAAQAQSVYRWIDENGEVHYGHSVPPEHAHRGYDLIGPDGMVRQRVERALTEEERAEREAERRRQAILEAEQRSQDSRDRQLLAAYGSEEDIVQAMEMQITAINHQRSSIRDSLRRASGRFESLVTRASRLTHEGQPVPVALERDIDDVRGEIQTLRRGLQDLDQREEAVRRRAELERTRFRELTGG